MMQYLLTQKEYSEYISLKARYGKGVYGLSGPSLQVYNAFKDNPRITYRAVGEMLQKQPSAIHCHVRRLIEKGFMKKEVGGRPYTVEF